VELLLGWLPISNIPNDRGDANSLAAMRWTEANLHPETGRSPDGSKPVPVAVVIGHDGAHGWCARLCGSITSIDWPSGVRHGCMGAITLCLFSGALAAATIAIAVACTPLAQPLPTGFVAFVGTPLLPIWDWWNW
jgi:hypothetical protein